MASKSSVVKWFIVASAIAATIYGYRQFKLLKSVSLKFIKIKFDELSAEKLSLSLFIRLTNSSSIGFDVKGYLMDIYLNGVFIGKASGDNLQRVDGNSNSVLRIDFAATPKNILKGDNLALIPALLQPKKIKVKLKGMVSIGGGVLNIKHFPVDIEDTIENLTKSE